MEKELKVSIPSKDYFYSLYSDGKYKRKQYLEELDITDLWYEKGSVIYLYYTYPTHRRVYLVRFSSDGASQSSLPGLSLPVRILFAQYASRVDKTKRAVSYLQTHYNKAYSASDLFYHKLDIIIKEKGKIDYLKLDALCGKE